MVIVHSYVSLPEGEFELASVERRTETEFAAGGPNSIHKHSIDCQLKTLVHYLKDVLKQHIPEKLDSQLRFNEITTSCKLHSNTIIIGSCKEAKVGSFFHPPSGLMPVRITQILPVGYNIYIYIQLYLYIYIYIY